ncbi:ankyrin repeat-containing domain protein [Rhypophila decipiens]|uniref:Ankyrin repeat-containing domain protein n=1 Tax=Rhypophila decipiens TaxID=261697 RepID=A0AAN7B1J9_9PEZI|nr:ankyrin repeat-containing domain protein [Rhypophila decipiens]
MDGVSIVTSIITLSKTLQSFARLVADYGAANDTVREIKSTCEFANVILTSIKEQLDAHIEPALLPGAPNGRQQATGTRSTSVDLREVLRNNVSRLQLDVTALVNEVQNLFDPSRPPSLMGEWKSSGRLVWKKTYLEGMHDRIKSKLTHLQLVQNNLTAQANHAAFEPHSPDSVINSLSHLFRSPSQRRTSSDRYARQRLVNAVKERNGKEAEDLLHQVDPNFVSEDNDGLFPLHYAAKNADEPMMLLLLDRGARVDCSHAHPTPLMLALQNTRVAPALTLMSRGANVCQADPVGLKQSPLHVSARQNHYDIVQVLLGCNVDLNVRDREGHTPLFECVKSELRHLVPGDVGVLRILLEREVMGKRANPALGRYKDNFNPLHLAAQKGYVDDLELLLEATKALGDGLGPDSATTWDKKGRSALWYAASEGQVEAIKLLLRYGAQVNRHFQFEGAQQPTALWAMAASTSSAEDKTSGVLALLNAGAKADLGRNAQGQTLLSAMCEMGNASLVRSLLSKGADPRDSDGQGMQAIHHAAKTGNQVIVDILLKCESQTVDINCKDGSGATPLIYAAMNGHDYLVSFLERHQPRPADWRLPDNNESDAFYLACATGHTFCAIYLRALGAEINRPNHRRITPLHIAARGGHFDTVLWLLRNGADKNARAPTASGAELTPDEVAKTSPGIADPGLREAIASLIKHWTPDQAASVRWMITSNLR